MMPGSSSGILYVVATPIGNLGDISVRAKSILSSVDLIYCEDTRHSQKLLTSLGLSKPLRAFHAHNEAKATQYVIDALKNGQNIALVSDAGTPLISDPGYPLIHGARMQGIQVVPIPGPSALIAALSVSGLPCSSFYFAGFLPAKKAARVERLKRLFGLDTTLVFYESTHRLLDAMEDIHKLVGENRQMALAKEISKTYEQFCVGSVAEVKRWLEEDEKRLKGEFVLILGPPQNTSQSQSSSIEIERLLSGLMQELPLKKAVQLACELSGEKKNKVYEMALRLK